MAGGMPQKSPAESKAVPVTTLFFDKAVRLPGKGGACSRITTNPPGVFTGTADALFVQSIYEYQGRFCVDGMYWIPETCGSLVGWVY